MTVCTNPNERLFGGAVVLEVADGCSDTPPAEDQFKALGAGTSKGFDYNPNAVTSDADDVAGFVESIITNADLTFSFDGEVRKADNPAQYGIGKFIKMFNDAIANKQQPNIWVRLDYGPVKFVGFMVVTALSSDGGTNDIVTFSTEFKVANGTTVDVTLNSSSTTSPTNSPKY